MVSLEILSHNKKMDIRRDSVVNGARVNIGSAGVDPRESIMVRFSGLPGSKSMARIERSVEPENRNKRLSWIFDKVTSKLLGYYNYYGVMGNSPSLKTVRREVMNMICY